MAKSSVLQIAVATASPVLQSPRATLLSALLVGALLSTPSAAAPGDLVSTWLPPQPTGHMAGIAWDGSDRWVATLAVAGDTSENSLLKVAADGDVAMTVIGGASAVFQKIAHDGDSLWAVDMYDELHRLDENGESVESFDIPFSQGLSRSGVKNRLYVLEGMSSQNLHLVEDGVILETITTETTHSYWWGLAFDGCSLWTFDLESDDLLRLDLQTGAVLQTLPGPTNKISGLTFDGTHLLASETSADLLMEIEIGDVMIDGELCTPSRTTEEAPAHDPVEEPVEDPTEVPTDEPVETPMEDPIEEPIDEPAQEPVEDPADSEAPSDELPSDDTNGDDDGAADPADDEDRDAVYLNPDEVRDQASLDDDELGGCRCTAGPAGTTTSGVGLALILGTIVSRRRRKPRNVA